MEPKKDAKKSYSKKILALLTVKSAISVRDLENSLLQPIPQLNAKHALKRSLRGLEDTGLIETHHSGQQSYSRLTREGKRKAHSITLENDTGMLPAWDGKWRIILLDVAEDRKAERDGLRYLLKKAGFILLKNSVWISPYPLEHLFMNIKKDLGLTTEIMIFVTDTLDDETAKAFFDIVKK